MVNGKSAAVVGKVRHVDDEGCDSENGVTSVPVWDMESIIVFACPLNLSDSVGMIRLIDGKTAERREGGRPTRLKEETGSERKLSRSGNSRDVATR